MIKEVFKPVLGYEDFYEISNIGRVFAKPRATTGAVKGIKKRKEVSITDNGNGYKIVSLSDNGRKNHYVHRLVAIHFIDNLDNYDFVNHKNGIKSDNTVDNLEWCTILDNNRHARANNLAVYKGHSFKKISVCMINLDTNNKLIYASITKMAKAIGVSVNAAKRYVDKERIIDNIKYMRA